MITNWRKNFFTTFNHHKALIITNLHCARTIKPNIAQKSKGVPGRNIKLGGKALAHLFAIGKQPEQEGPNPLISIRLIANGHSQ